MSDQWQYQLRLYLPEGLVDVARSDPDNSVLNPLPEILAKHDAAIRCQFDAFAGYVAEAEKHGTEDFPLYAWTKATIEDPAKKAKHLRSFAVILMPSLASSSGVICGRCVSVEVR